MNLTWRLRSPRWLAWQPCGWLTFTATIGDGLPSVNYAGRALSWRRGSGARVPGSVRFGPVVGLRRERHLQRYRVLEQ